MLESFGLQPPYRIILSPRMRSNYQGEVTCRANFVRKVDSVFPGFPDFCVGRIKFQA
ncbi:MAG: hypothetical protein JWM11_3181 [Planctomycetaceae bacterium]|nr:hypothetical protein [Planctomycetaceae bacterium]